jgi:hypothetical protein
MSFICQYNTFTKPHNDHNDTDCSFCFDAASRRFKQSSAVSPACSAFSCSATSNSNGNPPTDASRTFNVLHTNTRRWYAFVGVVTSARPVVVVVVLLLLFVLWFLFEFRIRVRVRVRVRVS